MIYNIFDILNGTPNLAYLIYHERYRYYQYHFNQYILDSEYLITVKGEGSEFIFPTTGSYLMIPPSKGEYLRGRTWNKIFITESLLEKYKDSLWPCASSMKENPIIIMK